MRRLGFLSLAIATIAAPVMARHDTAGCGTTGTTPAEVMFLHRQAERARAARFRPLAAASAAASTNRDIGNVAIVENRDGGVETINPFDLDNATLTFTPAAGGTPRYSYAYSGLSYDASAADRGSPVVALGDDDARTFTLPFAFPFYGAAYRQVFLNSDGNLTFTAAEFASTSRSLGRMTGGPPRIAPLFDDLDPTQPGGGVRFYADASHVVFSWLNVPEYGPGAPQTFQVRLNVDGSIQFSYSGVSPTSAVVGIAPGSAAPGTSVVSFRFDPSAEYAAAVAERFGNTQEVDIVTVAQKFYETHDDAFTVPGTKAGVEELLATPADSSYETAFARLQVAAASQLTLRTVSGDNQVPGPSGALPAPVVVRLTDANGLPHPGALIQAVAAGGSVTPATATAHASGQASLQWTPGTGSANQLNLSLTAAPTVTLTLMAGSAVPVIEAVVNAASFGPGVAPGSLATPFGAHLATASVWLSGTDVRPFYSSDTQVNFYVPAETPIGANVFAVRAPNGLQVSSTISLVAVQPGIFSGAVVHAGTTVSALTTPVRAGDYIEIYCTGLGPTRLSGGLSPTTIQPTIYIGSTPVPAAFSGLAPGFVGLYQVDVQIPAGLPSGPLPLAISSGSTYSNTVNIAVQ